MKILAIDLGDARTGVAVSDIFCSLASPLCTIKETNKKKLLWQIKKIIEEQNVQKIILGLPKNMDGSEGERAQKSRKFGEELEKISRVEVIMQDERSTTVLAHNFLNQTDTRGVKRKNIVDCVAAAIILQSYLDSLKNKK